MRFSDLATHLGQAKPVDTTAVSDQALIDIQEQYLFDVSGAEVTCTGSGGSGGTFNAFCSWSKAV